MYIICIDLHVGIYRHEDSQMCFQLELVFVGKASRHHRFQECFLSVLAFLSLGSAFMSHISVLVMPSSSQNHILWMAVFTKPLWLTKLDPGSRNPHRM